MGMELGLHEYTEGSAGADIETIAAHLLLSFWQTQVANHELMTSRIGSISRAFSIFR